MRDAKIGRLEIEVELVPNALINIKGVVEYDPAFSEE